MDIKTELKKLILDERFSQLQTLVNQEINLMSILNVAHKELQHSNFLAWLFDPKETHNLKDWFIKEFIKLYFIENEYNDLGSLSVFDFAKLDLTDLEVKREHENIDLLLISKKNQLFVLIENKIFSPERKGQLTKYREYAENVFANYPYKIFIYLSLKEQSITEEEQEYYTQISYDHIVKLIENTANKDISENVKFVLNQYLQTIKSIMNENEQIEKIAQELYEEYKTSFDLVFKYIKPIKIDEKYINTLKELVINEPSLIFVRIDSNSFIQFRPKLVLELRPKLVEKGYVPENYDLLNSPLFNIFFHIESKEIFFYFQIGPYENQVIRRKIYEIYKKHKDYLQGMNRKLSDKFHSCHKISIVKLDEDIEENELIDEILKNFKKIMKEDMPKIEKIIRELVE